MLLLMGWLARLCDSSAQRWAWIGSVGILLLGLGLGLEIGTRVLR